MPQPREPKVGEIQEYADAKSRNKTGRRQEVGAFSRDSDSNRLTNEQLYGRDKLFEFYEDLIASLIDLSTLNVIVVWGGQARRWFKKRFGILSDGKYKIIDDVEIGGVERTVVFLPQPEHIGRWTDARIRKQVSQIVEEVYARCDVSLSLVRLEKQLRTHEQLRHVRILRTSQEELDLQRTQNRPWSGKEAYPGESEVDRAARHQARLHKSRDDWAKLKAPKDGETQEDADARMKAKKKKMQDRRREPREGETQEDALARVKAEDAMNRNKRKLPRNGETPADAIERVKEDRRKRYAKSKAPQNGETQEEADARVKARTKKYAEMAKAPRDGEAQEDADARIKARKHTWKKPKAGETQEETDGRANKKKPKDT